jgi:hypothetical protein
MRSQFFVERYAHEKHEAHLREAAHDRLSRDLRPVGHPVRGRIQAWRLAFALSAALRTTLVVIANKFRL